MQEQELAIQEDEPVQEDGLFKPMSESELVSIVMEELGRGIGGKLSTDSQPEITLGLDYYLGRMPGISKVRAKDKNASRFISQDVMDSIEATVAEIMPAYCC